MMAFVGSFGGFVVVMLAMVCSVLLAPSLALTKFKVILGIRDDLIDWLFVMATNCWFCSMMAGGFALGCKIRRNSERIPELRGNSCEFDRNVVPIQR